jgi:predicted RND superfamily exporter protein
MSKKILAFVEPLVFERRRPLLVILLAITAAFAFMASQIRSDSGFDKTLPLDHAYVQILKQYQSDFGSGNTLLVALMQQSGDIYNERFLSQLKAASDDVASLKGIDRTRVSSLFTPEVRYVDVIDGAFKGDSVVPSDYAPTQPMFDRIRGNVAKGGYVGRYVANDQRGAMIFAEVADDTAQLDGQLEALRRKYERDGITVRIVGHAKRAGELAAATKQAAMFFAITLTTVFVWLWLSLGSLRLALLALLASVIALIWEFGLLSVCGFGLQPLALMVPLLILAISLSHCLQLVNAWTDEIVVQQRNVLDASRHAWRRIATPGVFAMLGCAAGFATLALLPIGIIRDIAINAVFGMAGVLVSVLVILPIALSGIGVGEASSFAAAQKKRAARFDGLWHLLSNAVKPKVAATTILIAATLLGGALWLGRGLRIGDDRAAAPELAASARFNQDFQSIAAQFDEGVDTLKIIAETDPEACVKFDVMEQVDRFAWHLQNTAGVRSALSLPQQAKIVNQAFSEASPKYDTLPRNKQTMAQALSPIAPATGLLNPTCSAMPVFVFLQDHRAETIARIVDEVQFYNHQNATAFYESNKSVTPKYCNAKLAARRAVGLAKIGATADLDNAQKKLAGLTKECPVNFALAAGDAGVIAASLDEVLQRAKPALFYFYGAIAIAVYACFFDIGSLIAILLPLSLVSWLAYALMSAAGIGLSVASMTIVPLAAAIGVDYAISLYARMKDELERGHRMQDAYRRTLQSSGKAVLVIGIALTLGVASWLWSGLQFQRDLGLMLGFAFVANLLVALVVLPGVASFLLREQED